MSQKASSNATAYEVLVDVRSGRDLANKKMMEKHAIYVKVHVDELTEKTETMEDLEIPRWNRQFKFVVHNKPKLITFEVKDDRTLLPNVKLGNYKIDIDQMIFDIHEPVKIIDGEVPLADVKQGSLNVAVTIQPEGWNKDSAINRKEHIADEYGVNAANNYQNADVNANAYPNQNSNVNANLNPNLNSNVNHNLSSNLNPNNNYNNQNANLNPNLHSNLNVNQNPNVNPNSNLNQNSNENLYPNLNPNNNNYNNPNSNLNSNVNVNPNMNMNVNNNPNVAMNEQLTVKLIDAQGLKKADLLSKSDPYVKICIGNDIQQSKKAIWNNNDAIWNETFIFNIDNNNMNNIEIQLLDDDILKDDNMGIGIINHSDILNLSNNIEKDFRIPLLIKNESFGVIQLTLFKNVNNYNSNIQPLHEKYNQNINYKSDHLKRNEKVQDNINYQHSHNIEAMDRLHGEFKMTIRDISHLDEKENESLLSNFNCYLIIEFGNERKKTQTCVDRLHPIFNETFIFSMNINDLQDIKLDLINNNLLKDNDMGTGYITKNDLLNLFNSSIPQDYNISLFTHQNQQQIGVLNIQLQMIDSLQQQQQIQPQSLQQSNQPLYQENIQYEQPIQLPSKPLYNNNSNNNLQSANVALSNLSLNTDAPFLLTVMDAQALKKGDMLSKSDPYIMIKFDNQTLKTKTVKNSEIPNWNEQFRVHTLGDIELLLMDDDLLKDDQIGKTILQKERLMRVGMNDEDINLPILMKNQEVGKIHIRMRKLDSGNNHYEKNLQNQDVNTMKKDYQYETPSSGVYQM